jgi:thioredoxin reductase (NADPH)
MEEALFLTRFANKVTVVHRRDELRASKIMQDRAMANEKLDFIWNAEVQEVLGEESVTGVRLHDVRTDDTQDLEVGGVFVAIGHVPNTQLFEGQLELDNGYVTVQEPTTRTSVDGAFAAGDVVDHIYRQAVTAAGMGCQAAIDAERFLEANAA